jgi:leucine efflux protein
MFLGITDYPAFVVAILVFLALPGPGTLMLLASVGQGGMRGGVAAIGGLLLGDQILMWLAALGVAAVLHAQPVLFKALQLAGAAYLIWIGARLIFARGADSRTATIEAHVPGSDYFRRALLVTVLNPKAIVFFMAFFPLFIDPATHRGGVTFAAMAFTVAVVAAVYCLALCAGAQAIRARLRANPLIGRVLEKTAGVFIAGFGVKLAQ